MLHTWNDELVRHHFVRKKLAKVENMSLTVSEYYNVFLFYLSQWLKYIPIYICMCRCADGDKYVFLSPYNRPVPFFIASLMSSSTSTSEPSLSFFLFLWQVSVLECLFRASFLANPLPQFEQICGSTSECTFSCLLRSELLLNFNWHFAQL